MFQLVLRVLCVDAISGGVSRCSVSRRVVVIRAMADPVKKKKEDSAVKRARIAEARRIYNKSRKTEIKTRMKKVKFRILA